MTSERQMLCSNEIYRFATTFNGVFVISQDASSLIRASSSATVSQSTLLTLNECGDQWLKVDFLKRPWWTVNVTDSGFSFSHFIIVLACPNSKIENRTVQWIPIGPISWETNRTGLCERLSQLDSTVENDRCDAATLVECWSVWNCLKWRIENVFTWKGDFTA